MRQSLILNVLKSVYFHRKDAFYQIIIIALLSAIITGSLLTGFSVTSSLKRTLSEKRGEADFLISSGMRYFKGSLADRISATTGEKAVAILESEGYCQNFVTSTTVLNVKIFGVEDNFFSFNGLDTIRIESGTVGINTRLSEMLDIKAGEDIIIYIRDPDPIPDNAPFAPSRKNSGRLVLKTGIILTPGQSGNFSLGVSQLEPLNIFMNSSDLGSGRLESNRILLQNRNGYKESDILRILGETLEPSDIGLTVRRSQKTSEPEIVSERIFLDSLLVNEISKVIPESAPVLTYLANSLSVNVKTTPYSFVSALPESSGLNIEQNEVIIGAWLANDLNAKPGDTLGMTWYYPGPGNLLNEKSSSFIIRSILDEVSPLLDPSLMPDFPGISGSTTCSDGMPVFLYCLIVSGIRMKITGTGTEGLQKLLSRIRQGKKCGE